MKVLLLAAGKGTRMLPLTATTPKPLLRVGSCSLIEHQIRKLRAQGFRELVINHAWLGSQLEQALGDGSSLGVQISWSREGEPLETAGGIVRALPLLGSKPFAVVNADIWTDYSFLRLATALAPQDLVHLVLVPNPLHHPAGDFTLDTAGRLGLHGVSKTPLPTCTYSGIGVYNPRLFAGLADGSRPLLPLLKQAIAAGRASGELYAGDWIDVGTPARLVALDQQLQGPSASNDSALT
jgi:MurNAc alpha-1-phosphate uridylyltransferase